MQVHLLLTLSACGRLNEARATALDLDPTPCLLLNVFDVCTAMSDNLRPEIETRDGLEVDGNLFIRPFSLDVTH